MLSGLAEIISLTYGNIPVYMGHAIVIPTPGWVIYAHQAHARKIRRESKHGRDWHGSVSRFFYPGVPRSTTNRGKVFSPYPYNRKDGGE